MCSEVVVLSFHFKLLRIDTNESVCACRPECASPNNDYVGESHVSSTSSECGGPRLDHLHLISGSETFTREVVYPPTWWTPRFTITTCLRDVHEGIPRNSLHSRHWRRHPHFASCNLEGSPKPPSNTAADVAWNFVATVLHMTSLK